MIQGLLVKVIFKLVMKSIAKKYDMDSINKYVHNDNELDIQVKQLQKNNAKQGKYIEELEKEVATLKVDSHPPIKNIEKRIKWLEKKARR